MANYAGSVSDLLDPLIRLLGRAGRVGGIVAVVIGVALCYQGVHLFLHAVEGGWSPIMLAIPAIGVVFVMLGLGVLFGAQSAVGRAIGEIGDAPAFQRHVDAAAAARGASLPFWVCGHCRVVEPGVASTGRCGECGQVGNFMQATTEAERATAIACLG